MHPNYSKAFLDLKDVFVKNVIQADSFLKVFTETKLLSRPVLVVAAKQKEFMTTESRKLMTLLSKVKPSFWF
jgi:hypothetical protein